MAQINLSTKQKDTHGDQTYGCQGGGLVLGEEGWSGSLGLVDINYHIWNGYTTRSHCISQGTIIQSPGINHNGK